MSTTGEGRLPPSPRARARLIDVATLAGVSKATASKALNDRFDVGESTRRRVREAAERLSFQPNTVARSLLAGRTGTVGVLTNDLEGRFVLPILAGAEDALSSGEISVILCDARGDRVRERQQLSVLLSRRIDGLIVVGGAQSNPRPSLGRSLPMPVVYAYAPSTDPRDLSLMPDNVMAGRLAVEHLWGIGRRRIAYVGGDASYVASQQREQGARDALRELGGELITDGAVHGDWSERWGRAVTRRLLDAAPNLDAVVGGSDGLARAALDVLRDESKRVPEDVAVMGFDNWPLVVTNTRPELTSVDMRLEDLGRTAASKLFSALSGEDLDSGLELLPVSLVSRRSTVRDI